MPIIPLPHQNAIAPAPQVAIDRERRPTVDTSGVQSAVGLVGRTAQQPSLPDKLGAAPYEALGSVGQAVAQTGSLLGAFAVKKREAESDVQIAEADKKMEMKSAEFGNYMRDNPDPTKWEGEWATRSAQAREEINSNESLHPGAREQINLRATKWDGTQAAEVKKAAGLESFRQAKSGYLDRLATSINTQNKDAFEQDAATAESKGYLYKHDVGALREQFTRTGERQKREGDAEAERLQYEAAASDAIRDPHKWMEDNKEPWKGQEILWQRVKNVADARDREGTADIVGKVNDSIASGDIQTPKEVDAIESPLFTPALREAAKHYLAGRDQYAEKVDREENGVRNAVALRKEVQGYDPKNDPDRTRYFGLVQEISSRVDQSQAGELGGELYKKYGTTPPQLKVRPEIQRNTSKQLDVIFDPKTGAIPWKKEVVVKENGKKKKEWQDDPNAKRKALDAQTTVEMKMGDWFKENPDATLNDAKKKLNDFLPEGTRGGALDALQKLRAPSASTRTTEAGQMLVSQLGGRFEQWADRDIRGRPGVKSMHATGQAIDYYNTPQLLQKAATGAAQPGTANRVIYNRRIWEPGKGWNDYHGENPHTDHVHIEPA